jgi:monoamine oxidase
MNRRTIIAAAGLSAISAFPAKAKTVNAKVSHSDVAVIGAGLAGLQAALLLQEQGVDVQVYEARARVGGRLETADADGMQLELGAVEVGDNYARFAARAQALKVKLLKPKSLRIPGITVAMDGVLLNETAWLKSALNPMQDDKLRAMAPNMWLPVLMSGPNPLQASDDWHKPKHQHMDVPLRQYLMQQGQNDAQILRMMEIASNYNDFSEVSALDVLRRDALRRAAGPTAGTLVVEGGSQALPNAMAAALQRPVQQAVIAQIQRQGVLNKRFVLRDTSGVEIAQAKAVVVAAAAPAMASIAIEALQAELKPLWERPMTRVSTVHFRPTEKFWEADGLSPNMWIDGPLERVFAVANPEGEIARLIVWMNGRAAAAVDALGADLVRFVQLELGRIRPACRGKLKFLAQRSWGEEVFSGGAYVEIAAGQCAQVANAQSMLAHLPKGLAFAGEHTVLDFSGMEAALVSGERAVQQLQNMLKR